MGLTPYLLVEAHHSWFCSAFFGSRMPTFLYFALIASICGLSACILRIDFMFESLMGNNSMLSAKVTATMDHPKLLHKGFVETSW